jgi:hypothetical protein
MNFARIIRTAGLLLGGWLFISAFLWRHAPAETLNVALVGALTVGLSLTGRGSPGIPARAVMTALAVWLFASTFLLTMTVGTFVNNLLVSTLLFGFASLPIGREAPTGGRVVA